MYTRIHAAKLLQPNARANRGCPSAEVSCCPFCRRRRHDEKMMRESGRRRISPAPPWDHEGSRRRTCMQVRRRTVDLDRLVVPARGSGRRQVADRSSRTHDGRHSEDGCRHKQPRSDRQNQSHVRALRSSVPRRSSSGGDAMRVMASQKSSPAPRKLPAKASAPWPAGGGARSRPAGAPTHACMRTEKCFPKQPVACHMAVYS